MGGWVGGWVGGCACVCVCVCVCPAGALEIFARSNNSSKISSKNRWQVGALAGGDSSPACVSLVICYYVSMLGGLSINILIY